MNKSKVNVLMTGAGAPGAAGILKCLAKDSSIRVTAADVDPEAYGRHLGGHFAVIPRGDDPGFIDAILQLCRQREIGLLMPLVTKELLPLAVNRDKLEAAGVRPMLSSAESLEIANDKSRLHQFLEWRGIEVPAFRVIETADQLASACRELGYPDREVVIRPAVSNGSRGFRIISERKDRLELFLNQKPGDPYTTLADLESIFAGREIPVMLLTEYLGGDEFSVDCLCDRGETIIALPRKRIKTINGITVRGLFVNDASIISYCRSIISELKLHGNIGLQLKGNDAGRYLILEINPRVQGTISAALGAGTNLPLLAVRQECGLSPAKEDLEVKWGTGFDRYWEEIFY